MNRSELVMRCKSKNRKTWKSHFYLVHELCVIFSIEFQVPKISRNRSKRTNNWIFRSGATKSFNIYSNATIRESNRCRFIPLAWRSREKHRYFQKLLPRYRNKFSIFNKLLFSSAIYILSSIISSSIICACEHSFHCNKMANIMRKKTWTIGAMTRFLRQ